MALMTTRENTRNMDHITTYQAVTRHAMHAYTLANDWTEVIPAGTIVEITENTGLEPGRVVVTMTVTLINGMVYVRNLKSDGSQFDRL